MRYIVKLTNRATGEVEYRRGEPGRGGVTRNTADAETFDCLKAAEAYVGRLATWGSFYMAHGNDKVTIEELPEPETVVGLTLSEGSAQFIRNLMGYIDFCNPNVMEIREALEEAGVRYQPSMFDVTADGIEPVKGVR